VKINLKIILDCPTGNIQMYEDLLSALKKIKKDIKKLAKEDRIYYHSHVSTNYQSIENKEIQLEYEIVEQLEH
jgi:hypothetical protein